MAASYPTSIKSFLTYQDQPGNNNVVPDPSNPGQTIDLTIDRAKITNEIHDEVVAVEQTIGTGTNPATLIRGQGTMGGEINWLYYNKAAGRVDPSNNAIYPTSVPTHDHAHSSLLGLGADDHTQYVRVDGSRGFRAPVEAPWGTQLNHLCPLGQAQHVGWLNFPQVEFIIYTTVAGKSSNLVVGPTAGRYRMTGGRFWGPSDSNGNVWIDYSAARFSGIVTVVYMKMPFPGASAYGYTFQYEEDQLVLLAISNTGFMVQFIEDNVVDRQANVAMAWMVVGV